MTRGGHRLTRLPKATPAKMLKQAALHLSLGRQLWTDSGCVEWALQMSQGAGESLWVSEACGPQPEASGVTQTQSGLQNLFSHNAQLPSDIPAQREKSRVRAI